MRHGSANTLLLLVMVYYCSVICVRAASTKCAFDSMAKSIGPLPVAVVQEIPTKESGSLPAYTLATEAPWEPLRILVSVEKLEDQSAKCARMCSENNEEHELRPNPTCIERCTNYYTMPEEKKKEIVDLITQSITLHTERLFVRRAKGPLKIPEFNNEICRRFNVTPEHRTKGVNDADMVLYVSLNHQPVVRAGPVWAFPCAVNEEGRPVAAVMEFLFDSIRAPHVVMRITAHHIAHALGFEINKMKSKSMISTKDVRSKTGISVATSDRVVKAAQWHYNCKNVDGMELEDELKPHYDHHDQERDNEEQSVHPTSHWEARNAMDELMGPLYDGSQMRFPGFYTVLTMAAFADLGYYAANFSMAEPMTWGRNAGCSLFTDKCVENGQSKHPKMFCDDVTRDKLACTSDRTAIGGCAITTRFDKPLPEHFRYFDSNTTGGLPHVFTDYCPVVLSYVMCGDTFKTHLPWPNREDNLWCLDGKSVKVKIETGKDQSAPWYKEEDATCAAVSCEGGEVRVKYLGSDDWQPCHEGTSINLPTSHYESGSITCPKYEEVCTVDANGSSLVATKPKKGTPWTDPFPGWTPKLPKAPIIEKGSGTPEGTQQDGGGTDGTGTSKAPVTNAGQPGTPEINWTKVQLANSSAIRSVSFVCVVILLMVVAGEWLA